MKPNLNLATLTGACLLSSAIAGQSAIIIDDFNYASFLNDQTYWTRYSSSGGNNAFTSGGLAVMRAQTDSNARSAIVSPLSSDFNFFNTGFTIGVAGLELSNNNLADNQTLFRVALSSTAQRQFDAGDAVTLRLDRAGNVMFGYKVNQGATDAENKSGTVAGGLESFVYSGTVSGIELSLNPLTESLGITTVAYTIALDGSAGLVTESGTFDVSLSFWGSDGGDSSLMLESRRQASTAVTGSYARANVDKVTYAPIPEPSTFAITGLGALLWVIRRRK